MEVEADGGAGGGGGRREEKYVVWRSEGADDHLIIQLIRVVSVRQREVEGGAGGGGGGGGGGTRWTKQISSRIDVTNIAKS